jgi:predicted Zn-dependent peptidase
MARTRQQDTPLVHTLPNGVRILLIDMPHLGSASVSVFVRSGSLHETARQNGINHVAEHMAFKGTHTRDAKRINLDAERLGADVNAHTDKDHTAFHMSGLARHAPDFVRMLADIVLEPTFPEEELERERGVILQELMEDEDDPVSTAFKLLDHACFGTHPMARPVIGQRRNIERFTRDDLLGYRERQYTGCNIVIAVAGRIGDAKAIIREAKSAFGALPAGEPNATEAPVYEGGAKARRMAGSSQSHAVIGHPLPGRENPRDHARSLMAAAVLGEGMSSPLMHEIRESRGLAYYVACSADVSVKGGQFVIEASTTPEHLDDFFAEVKRLLRAQAEAVSRIDMERAHNQLAVRHLRNRERAYRVLEDAAQDLFVHGRVRSDEEIDDAIAAVNAGHVRQVFETMATQSASVALVGRLGAWNSVRLESWARRAGGRARSGRRTGASAR